MVLVVDQLPLPPRLLAALALDAAMSTDSPRPPAPPAGKRSYQRLHATDTHDVWLIRWGPGSTSGLHDHAGSTGAFCVVEGRLVEHVVASREPVRRTPRVVRPAEHRPMSAAHVHEVVNESPTVATSVHAYSPPLRAMRHYDIDAGARLRVVRHELVTVFADTRV
jgi:predicted metal-dependent enzyme (double-stranded beta helix superfamily)